MKIQCAGSLPFIGGLTHSCRSFYSTKTHHQIALARPAALATTPGKPTGAFLTRREPIASHPSSPRAASTLPTMASDKWTGAGVRKAFLDFFEQKGHTIGMPARLRGAACT